MKSLFTFAVLMCCSVMSFAQTGPSGANGNTTQSTGFVPSGGNERLQNNRPDSTHSDKDTSYMNQQWNSAPQNQKKGTKSNKRKK